MTSIATKIHLAEQLCQQQGKRLTSKRKQILALLLTQKKALSAYELIALFNEQTQSEISPMTVYRILAFHESVHLAHKINITNKYIACSHIGCGHSHELPQFLICERCQRVDELDNVSTNLTEISQQAEQIGYQLSSPQIELSCICNACL
jgi:Fur family zinc uptake transcriptional regulator